MQGYTFIRGSCNYPLYGIGARLEFTDYLLSLDVRNKSFWITAAIPKIGDFNAVFKYAIDNLIKTADNNTTKTIRQFVKVRFYFANVWIVTYQTACMTHFLYELVSDLFAKLFTNIVE